MKVPSIRLEDVPAENPDAMIQEGVAGTGFLAPTSLDAALNLAGPRKELPRFFGAGDDAVARTLRNRCGASRPNADRGFFPAEPERNAMVEGFDAGPDIAAPLVAGDGGDPLTDPAPHPGTTPRLARGRRRPPSNPRPCRRDADPGPAPRIRPRRGRGRQADRSRHLHSSPAAIPSDRPAPFGSGRRVDRRENRFVTTKFHAASGFVTPLWQDPTGDLPAETREARVDVPPTPGGHAAKFGQMLGDWSGGRIRATPHRRSGGAEERHSVPHFLERAIDSVFAPLFPGSGRNDSVCGDFLWERMASYPNFPRMKRSPAASAGQWP